MYIYICVYMYIYIYSCKYIHKYIYVHIHIYIYIHTFICIYKYTCAYIYICIHVYIHMCIYVYIRICIYISRFYGWGVCKHTHIAIKARFDQSFFSTPTSGMANGWVPLFIIKSHHPCLVSVPSLHCLRQHHLLVLHVGDSPLALCGISQAADAMRGNFKHTHECISTRIPWVDPGRGRARRHAPPTPAQYACLAPQPSVSRVQLHQQ